MGDNPNDWSWAVYCNLPLVPFYLVASHVRTIDATIFSTVTLPMLYSLSFPPSSILAATHEPFELPRFLVTYPPTPALCLLAYPFLRMWYTHVRDRLTGWVLQTEGHAQPDGALARRHTWVLEDNDNGADGHVLGADLRIDLDIEGPARVQPQQNPEQGEQDGPGEQGDQGGQGGQDGQGEQGRPANNGGDGDANQDDAGHRRVRVTFSSLGRFIGRVLVTPWVASYMGELLELLSRRSLLLRRVLSLHAPHVPPFAWMDSVARGSSALRRLGDISIRPPWQRPAMAMEPVW